MDDTSRDDPLEGEIQYLNSDLDLQSDDDLTDLAAALTSRGLLDLHVTKGDDGRWYACFEAGENANEPEPNIRAILEALESLPEHLEAVWARCSLREVNIGYNCGVRPWSFNQGLSNEVLQRLAALGLCLRVTIYPTRAPGSCAAAGGEAS